MLIEVTASDIAKGKPQTGQRHPLQIALKRQLKGVDHVGMSTHSLSYYHPHITQVKLDKTLMDYMSNFNRVDLAHWKDRRPHKYRKPTPPITIEIYPNTDKYKDNFYTSHYKAKIVAYHPIP